MATLIDSHFLAFTTLITVLTIGFYFSSSPRSSNSTKKHEFHYNCCIDTGDQRLVVFSTDNPDFVCWDMGNSPGAFPVIQVWTVSLPVTLVNASDKNPFLHVVDVIGWILVRAKNSINYSSGD
ncbi:hypothetical protein DEO72_LG3g3477 [Vigna unguiculata]|uniref:Uncharacterized protein n=1 Tax=Vigna unguiculata TaxID=3917 RepID=A0A4D6LKR0_VIGUN|nr:hypothetical protein DEO72_LG3g3477 [Vigna unguiculata]